jgi:hypothetical protein
MLETAYEQPASSQAKRLFDEFLDQLAVVARAGTFIYAYRAGEAYLSADFWHGLPILFAYTALVRFAWGPRK